ncbi:MAG: substrate-binding domain-containing protein [Pseudoclavibacter sp.]|nr:substrate-binding domain-containing protein [Pseudoclavibacter sp.]
MKNIVSSLTAAAALLLAVPLAACSSTGGAANAGGGPGGGGLEIALVTHAAAGDTFWDVVRKGAEDAAEVYGVALQYANDPEGSRQAQLVQQYVDQELDGIVVTLAKPEAMRGAVEGALAADVPVVSINAGDAEWREMGVTAHFGQDEEKAGEGLGEYLAEQGYEHPLCVIHEQGNVGHEARCAGLRGVLPKTEILYVDGRSMPQVTATVLASLQSGTKADVAVGLGAPYALAIRQAADTAGSGIAVGSFDVNPELLQGILDGGFLFGVDQQPYLQGYLAVEALHLQHSGGFVVGGGHPVLTGPAIVDAGNAEAVLEYARQGTR